MVCRHTSLIIRRRGLTTGSSVNKTHPSTIVAYLLPALALPTVPEKNLSEKAWDVKGATTSLGFAGQVILDCRQTATCVPRGCSDFASSAAFPAAGIRQNRYASVSFVSAAESCKSVSITGCRSPKALSAFTIGGPLVHFAAHNAT